MYKIINQINDVKFYNFFTPTKSDIMRNAEYKLYVEYSTTNVRKYTFSNRITPAWTALSLITKPVADVNKLKNLLDRDPNLLMNKLDCDSFFLIFFFKENSCMFIQT